MVNLMNTNKIVMKNMIAINWVLQWKAVSRLAVAYAFITIWDAQYEIQVIAKVFLRNDGYERFQLLQRITPAVLWHHPVYI